MHKNIEKMWYLSELILLTLLIYANGYDTKCPHSSQWNFTSKSYECMDQNIYICLLDELKTKTVYIERCGSEDISKEGSKYILKPDLDQVPCAASQYQPFTFTTNGNSQCVFSKSLCKSSGQVLANNGSSNIDRSCRCDYRQNYDYVIPPNDPCSCKPAEEDCSCYIRNCEDDKVMIADYRCMKRVDTLLPEDIKCPIISRMIPPKEIDAVDRKQFQPVSASRTWSKQAAVILIVVVIIYTDFDSQSTPTVYNVFKGDAITLEQHNDSQQKLIAVKWFKESDIWTELDISNEQYSGGVIGVPSLTIKTTTLGNAGNYSCLLIYDNGDRQKAVFKLKIIPQVKIYKALCEHREDKTFIRPAIFETIDKHMQENNIVVISGREGSGKSKICLELASIYDEKNYMVLNVDLSENHSIYTDVANALLIIDDHQYTKDSLNTIMKHLLPVMLERNIKVILSCRYLDLEIVSSVSEIIPLKGEPFIDINSCLTPEEKEEILRRYIKENNIAISAVNVSNIGNPEIVTNLSIPVTLADDTIKVISNEEPWKGFPLCAALFCSERKFLHLGEKYFTNPPRHLVEKLKELHQTARKASNCIGAINEYCILVYIMNNNNHQLDLNDSNLCSQLDELYQTFFNFKNKPEKPGSNEDQKKSIEEAVHRMDNKYLEFHEGVYEFIHPCLLKAMLFSSNSMIPYLIQNGSLHDITEFVRSEDYTALEDELVIKIGEQYHHILCERLVSHAFENRDFLRHVAQYIYSYWRSSGTNIVYKMFKYIDFILFESFGVDTVDPLSFDNACFSEKSINLESPVQFSKVIVIIDELTYKGRDPWIYGPVSADFLILSALVSAALNRYAKNRVQTFQILLDEFMIRVNLKSFVKLWSKPLDIYGNTFFHYLMALNQKESSAILSMHAEMKYTFDTENVKKYTPLDIAAFLGKIDIFKVLNMKTSNCTNTLRSRLSRLAKRGKDEYFNKGFKNKNIDQLVIRKTKGDGASTAKLDNKNNPNLFALKRNLRHMKIEYNEKEKHDKKNVLCFEDFMMNVVENEKIDDYQSIIKLFQKID